MEYDTHIKHLVCVLHLVKQLKAVHEDLGKRTREHLLRVLYRIMQDKLAESKVAPTVMMELLTALREAREDLVFRSVNEDPQLYSSFFQYEKNENLLSLSFEREYSIFINANLEKLSIRITDINDEVTQRKLKHITEEFVSFKQSKSTSCIDSFFLEDKVKQIEKIFSIFDKDKDRLEEINYIRRKDQVLFEREFNRLLGEQNGDI
ncbi:hypothetical protein Tola_2287 [Tolumonas auensis DSM 9187]|uniref:Uncharacterized protein n=1 Tax=Tolumonas auensis (strain DSM 9187 / NBRC 110442 / TA 4) TaxID=595494 RepID=C4L915_TOLAT|nr:hypothetical protein [Tolumonas auensis]ACQ93885.1 hypothetical protein Tola_2287 [Tolumonas auensis DSM 9187]